MTMWKSGHEERRERPRNPENNNLVNPLHSQRPRLSKQERERFIEQYLLCMDEEKAAQRIGLPASYGKEILRSPRIQNSIAFFQRRRALRTDIYTDEVLRRWWLLATADVRELMEVRRVACRHCYGIDHRYQYTLDELRAARQKHMVAQMQFPEKFRVEFDDQGGDGYDGTKEPAKGCTECYGEGVVSVYIADTRTLSPAAALLYNGVEVGRDGSLKMQLRDRDAAMNMVAKHLGMVVNRQAITVFQPEQMTDEQLNLAIKSFENLLGPADGSSSNGSGGETIEGESEEVGE